MKAKLLLTMRASAEADPGIVVVENGVRFILKDSVIDHRDAWKLVLGGYAVAADEECAQKCEDNPHLNAPILREVHERLMAQHEEAMADIYAELEEEEREDDDDE